MKKAVVFGGGNIGRGLAGRIFYEAGYSVSFVDVNMDLNRGLNEKHEYPLYITMGDNYDKRSVKNVCAVDGRDMDAICKACDEAEIAATACGVNVLPIITKSIAAVIKHRFAAGNKTPFNFILCENKIDVHLYVRELLRDLLTEEEYAFSEKYIGFCQSSIGCMVPAPPKEIIAENPLTVCVEDYNKIYTDKSGAVGEFPEIPNIIAYEPFSYYINRKLFMHNMSHCVCAYLGYKKGYDFIWQAIGDPEIKAHVKAALNETASAMSKHYGTDIEELNAHADDLIKRYGNKLLGDTVKRVGGDPKRKLSVGDRLVGASKFCLENGVVPEHIIPAILIGFEFDPEGDPTASEVSSFYKENGLKAALEKYCSLKLDDELYKLIVKAAE